MAMHSIPSLTSAQELMSAEDVWYYYASIAIQPFSTASRSTLVAHLDKSISTTVYTNTLKANKHFTTRALGCHVPPSFLEDNIYEHAVTWLGWLG